MLKWGLLGRGVKSAKLPPTPYVYYPPRCSLVPGAAAGDLDRLTLCVRVYAWVPGEHPP